MKQILVYGDSLTWGIVPNTRQRLPFPARWPGVMERDLTAAGHLVRVTENCLNGRRTVWDDPYKPGRNGLAGIEQQIEINSPLALVIVMLGTNDFQVTHPNTAWLSAQGTAALIRAIRRAPIEPGMSAPEILIVTPPAIQVPKAGITPKFVGAEQRCEGLARAHAEIALAENCRHFDSGSVITTSAIDGIHLDAAHHVTLGRALARQIAPLLT